MLLPYGAKLNFTFACGRLFDAVLEAMLVDLKGDAAGRLSYLSSLVLAHGMMQHPIPDRHVDAIVEAACRDSRATDRREACPKSYSQAKLQLCDDRTPDADDTASIPLI